MNWTNSYTGELTANAFLTSDMRCDHEGTLQIRMADMEQTIRLFSPQGGEGLTVVNGISCARTRTGAVPCCGDLLEENSFAADKGGAGVLPTARSF